MRKIVIFQRLQLKLKMNEMLRFKRGNEMSLGNKEKKQKVQAERRGFLKKTAYAAPTLLALGALTKPTKVKAGFGGPPSDPAVNAW